MNLLITGIAGFIGSKIAQKALEIGYKVVGVDDLSKGYKTNIPKDVDFFELDLSLSENIKKLPKNIHAILHLAGQSSGEISFDDPVEDLRKNTISTLNLIQYGIQNACKKIMYASSMSVYGTTENTPIAENYPCSPLSCYGVGKLAAENYLAIYQSQLPYTAFRMFNVYGPGQDMANLRQGMVSIYLAHILRDNHIPIKGSIERFRDFIYIDDVVDIWLKAIDHPQAHNQCFNLGTGVKTTIAQLLEKIKIFLPGFTYEETKNTNGDQFGIYADTTHMNTIFADVHCTPLDKGLEQFIGWLQEKHTFQNAS